MLAKQLEHIEIKRPRSGNGTKDIDEVRLGGGSGCLAGKEQGGKWSIWSRVRRVREGGPFFWVEDGRSTLPQGIVACDHAAVAGGGQGTSIPGVSINPDPCQIQ